MTQPINWITDRPPTAADADKNGEVIIDCICCGIYFFRPWSIVGTNVPWCHTGDWQPLATPESKPTKPALAVGQRWRRRDGKVVTITEHDHDPNTNYPICATIVSVGKHWYYANGTSCRKNPDYELIELLPAGLKPTPTPTPRRFASVSRTTTDFGHVMDAIDDDGVAWWMMTLAPDDSEPEWYQLTPLPGREVVA